MHFKISTMELFEDSDLYEVTNFGKVNYVVWSVCWPIEGVCNSV